MSDQKRAAIRALPLANAIVSPASHSFRRGEVQPAGTPAATSRVQATAPGIRSVQATDPAVKAKEAAAHQVVL